MSQLYQLPYVSKLKVDSTKHQTYLNCTAVLWMCLNRWPIVYGGLGEYQTGKSVNIRVGNQYLIRVSALVHVLSLCILCTLFIGLVTTAVRWEGRCGTWREISGNGPALISACPRRTRSESIIPRYDRWFEKHPCSTTASHPWISSNAIILFSIFLDGGNQGHKIASGAGTLGDNAGWASGKGGLENSSCRFR